MRDRWLPYSGKKKYSYHMGPRLIIGALLGSGKLSRHANNRFALRANDGQQARAHGRFDLRPGCDDLFHLCHPGLQVGVDYRRFFDVCTSLCTGLYEAVVSLFAQARLQK